jgi:hypothetical protein
VKQEKSYIVMPLRVIHLCIVVIAALTLSCRNGPAVDSQKARAFGDLFMDDLIHDRRDAVYSKMEAEFHNLTNKEQFVDGLDTIYEQVGKPSTFEQFSYGPGVRVLYNGQTKPTCEIVYNVTTTKGVYPLPFGLLITEMAWL